MMTLAEIRQALSQLSRVDRAALAAWLQDTSELGHKVEEANPAYQPALPTYMTPEEFFDLEERSPVPYEYVNGVIRAMLGPSLAHCRITQNLFVAVKSRLGTGPCEAFCTGLSLRLWLGDDKIIYKPDLFVSCEPQAWNDRWIPNPKLVVEVLSPSTQHIDRREKAVNYRRVPSLEEYVLISQKRAELTIYRRGEHWLPEVVCGLSATAELRSLGLSVRLAEIFDRVH